jgi:uncharacterized membrane protein
MIALYWPPLWAVVMAAHVLANLVWIGALLAEVVLLGPAPWLADPAEAGTLARRVHTRLAIPAFLASVGAGLVRLVPSRHAYAAMPWMYAKLVFALGLIVLHHIIGARSRRVARGSVRSAQGAGNLGWLTLLFAAGAVLFAIAKSTP